MKFLSTILISLVLILSSCSHPQLENTSREVASEKHLALFDGTEPIAKGVKELLNEEQNLHNKDLWGAKAFDSNIAPEYVPEANPKFPLAYYLMPEEDAKFLQADSLDKRISSQLMQMIDGKKYFKLFVHPESEAHYEFLKANYKYVSQDETEFTASPTSSYRSLVVWDHTNKKKKAFIAKVSLDKNVIGSIDRLVSENEVERSVANQKVFDKIGKEELEKMHVKVFPESAGLVLDQEMPGAPKKLGGQLIREIPDGVVESKTKWLSFSALMSPNRKPRPLIMDVIKASGLSSYDFYEKYMINSYIKMFEELSLKQGMNFEPHSQNLCFEVGMDLKPTDNWVLRDFGGVWPDVITMAKNGGPVETYMEAGSALKYKLRGGRGNYISSYVFFYKRQVFDMMLTEVAKYDKTLTPKHVVELKNKLDMLYVEKINKYMGLKLKATPTMTNYKSIEDMILKNTKMDDSIQKKELSSNADLKMFISHKQDSGEYIELDSATKADKFYVTDHGIYELNKDKIVGISFFTKEERVDFISNKGVFANFKLKVPVNGFNCWGLIKAFQ
ncbi:MAG: hypothetical protein H7177_09240 [Rhizobacter sp.]|nr:hypothetical protein [Bacteriovorax sp.]